MQDDARTVAKAKIKPKVGGMSRLPELRAEQWHAAQCRRRVR